MAQNKNHSGYNLNTIDENRINALIQKSKGAGLQVSEVEELKQLKDSGRRAI